jgi:FkbM family methyltransferase
MKYKEQQLLKSISGIVHVGANRGQEIDKYAKFDLDVVWVEPIPEVFAQLLNNIKTQQKQRAFQALITDVDYKTYQFNVANNNGASSSIFQLKEHKEVWPTVHMTKTITLKSKTLATLFEEEQLDATKYQGLVMDTQGSELLVLNGSLSLLKYFRFIKTEVADFEAYEGCCQLSDMNRFMISSGFREYHRKKFGRATKSGGFYYNIIYIRDN